MTSGAPHIFLRLRCLGRRVAASKRRTVIRTHALAIPFVVRDFRDCEIASVSFEVKP